MYILIAAVSDEVKELKDSEKDHLVISGIGKLKAALAISEFVYKCKVRVDGVINLGTVGSDRISCGSLVEVTKSFQRDTSFFRSQFP